MPLVGNFPSSDGYMRERAAVKDPFWPSNSSGANSSPTSRTSTSMAHGTSAIIDKSGSSARHFLLPMEIERNSHPPGPSCDQPGKDSAERRPNRVRANMHQCDPVTFVDAPTGLVYNPKTGDLYVASTADNKVFALHDAATTDKDEGTGRVLYEDNTHLHGPLGMTMAPNGHLLAQRTTMQSTPDPAHTSEIVEFTLGGQFVKQLSVDPAQGGSFGLNVQTVNDVTTFAAVDDNANSLLLDLDFAAAVRSCHVESFGNSLLTVHRKFFHLWLPVERICQSSCQSSMSTGCSSLPQAHVGDACLHGVPGYSEKGTGRYRLGVRT